MTKNPAKKTREKQPKARRKGDRKKIARGAKTPAFQRGWPEKRRGAQQPTMAKNPAKKHEKSSQRREGKEIEKKSPGGPKHLRFKGVGPKSGEAPSSPR